MSGESESILTALKDFKTDFDLARSSYNANAAKNGEESEIKSKPPIISPELDQYLKDVAKTGYTQYPWKVVKPLVMVKLDAVLKAYNERDPYDKYDTHPNCKQETFQQLYTSIIESADAFTQAPFTIQRLCELICYPNKHYSRIDKYMRALEKIIVVVTTVDQNGSKLSCEPVEVQSDSHRPTSSTNLIPLFEWINKCIPHDANAMNFKPDSILRKRQSSGEWVPSFLPPRSPRLEDGDEATGSSADSAAELTPLSAADDVTASSNTKSQKRRLDEADSGTIDSSGSLDDSDEQSKKRSRTDEVADSESSAADEEGGGVTGDDSCSKTTSSSPDAVVSDDTEQQVSDSNSMDTLPGSSSSENIADLPKDVELSADQPSVNQSEEPQANIQSSTDTTYSVEVQEEATTNPVTEEPDEESPAAS